MVASGDIGILLNLVCIKHTGCSFPSNATSSTAWRYKTDDNNNKISQFSPYKDSLLLNPFKTEIDSHPIEHKIKRYIITEDIKEIFRVKLTDIDIAKGMILHDTNLLSDTEKSALVDIRNTMIDNYVKYYGVDYHRIVSFWRDFIIPPSRLEDYEYRRIFKAVIGAILSHANNPIIKGILDKFKSAEGLLKKNSNFDRVIDDTNFPDYNKVVEDIAQR